MKKPISRRQLKVDRLEFEKFFGTKPSSIVDFSIMNKQKEDDEVEIEIYETVD